MDKRAERVKGAVRGSIEHEFTNTWWGLKGVGGALVYCIKGFSFGKLLDQRLGLDIEEVGPFRTKTLPHANKNKVIKGDPLEWKITAFSNLTVNSH